MALNYPIMLVVSPRGLVCSLASYCVYYIMYSVTGQYVYSSCVYICCAQSMRFS